MDAIKEQMREKVERLEISEEDLDKTKKELTKIRSDYKDQMLLNQSLETELKALRDLSKETSSDVLQLKSECAQTLLSKEKST